MHKLPKPSRVVVDAVMEMLMTEQDAVYRPPEKAAAILALATELWGDGTDPRPWPPRQQVADHFNCSIHTVDAVLSSRIDEGYVIEIRETTTGFVQQRPSTVRTRYIKPSKHLQEIVESAKRPMRARDDCRN